MGWSLFCRPRIREKPLSDEQDKLLQESKQRIISSDEYKISVFEWENTNHSGHANTVLFTHGWSGNTLSFSHMIKHLITQGFNVIAFDSLVHGKSSGKTMALRNTQAILAITQHVGSIYVLVGHSLGSMTNAYTINLV
ncbi:MAG: alpha/beta fold hydrolase [Nitrosomonadaceae bacterium]|nr:alpha/beta fold hydrolase [Nitrosomonadaceae bacterium]